MGGRSFCLLYILWFVFMNILSTNAKDYRIYYRYLRYVPKEELKNMNYRSFEETDTFYKKVRDELFAENGIYKTMPREKFGKTEFEDENADATNTNEVKIDHIEPFLDHGVKVYLHLNFINYTSTYPPYELFSHQLGKMLYDPKEGTYLAQQKALYKDHANAISWIQPNRIHCAAVNFGQVKWPALPAGAVSNLMCLNSWRIDQYMVRKCLNYRWQPIDRSRCPVNFMNFYRFFLKVSPDVKPSSFLNNSKLINQIQNELDLDENVPHNGFSSSSEYANITSSHSVRLEVDRIEPFGGLDIRVMVKIHITNYTVKFPTVKEFFEELKDTLENPGEGSYLARASSLYNGAHNNRYYIGRREIRCNNIDMEGIDWPVLAENEESHTMCPDAVDIEQYMVMKCLKGNSTVEWQPIDKSRCGTRAVIVPKPPAVTVNKRPVVNKLNPSPIPKPPVVNTPKPQYKSADPTCNCKFLPFFNNDSQTFSGYEAVKRNCEKTSPSLKCIDEKCGDHGSEKLANPKAVKMLEKFRVFCQGECSYNKFANCLGEETLVGQKEKEKKKTTGEYCQELQCVKAWKNNCQNGAMYRNMDVLLKFRIESQITWISRQCIPAWARASAISPKTAKATSSTNALLPLPPLFLISTTSLVLTLTLTLTLTLPSWSVVTKLL